MDVMKAISRLLLLLRRSLSVCVSYDVAYLHIFIWAHAHTHFTSDIDDGKNIIRIGGFVLTFFPSTSPVVKVSLILVVLYIKNPV